MLSSKTLFYLAACVLCCVQMGVYIHYKLGGKGKAYTISKCAGSVIFIAVTALAPIFSFSDGYYRLILAAMILSGVGDYFLSLPSGHHRLKMGGVTFASAHICFITAFLYIGGFKWAIIPVSAALIAAEVLAARLMTMNFRGGAKMVVIYAAVVTTMAVCACSLLWSSMSTVSAVMTAVGGMLFLVSDMLWVMYVFIKTNSQNTFKVLNVLTYFPAQMLIAGALLFR